MIAITNTRLDVYRCNLRSAVSSGSWQNLQPPDRITCNSCISQEISSHNLEETNRSQKQRQLGFHQGTCALSLEAKLLWLHGNYPEDPTIFPFHKQFVFPGIIRRITDRLCRLLLRLIPTSAAAASRLEANENGRVFHCTCSRLRASFSAPGCRNGWHFTLDHLIIIFGWGQRHFRSSLHKWHLEKFLFSYLIQPSEASGLGG